MIQFFSNSQREGILKELPNLKDAIKIIKLCYPHNMISKISPSICKAHNVEEVDLSSNTIAIIDPIFQLRKLRMLNLSYNQIACIPKDILKLKKLERLDLSFNLLPTLASINPIFQLFKIRKANISISLDGNLVMQEHEQLYNQKISIILEQIKLANQKQKQKQLAGSKSLNLDKENYHSCQLITLNKTQHFQIQTVKPSINSLKQAKSKLQQSLNKLVDYDSKLKVIISMKFEGWAQQLFEGFQKQASIVNDYIQVYVKIAQFLTEELTNAADVVPRLQSTFIQGTQLKQLIKDEHSKFLMRLSESDVPMKLYKIWVQLYREVRAIIEQIKWQAWSIIKCQIRSEQIQTLKLISPTKQLKNEDQDLQNLLFSNKKCFNSQQPNIANQQCTQCFIKNEQNRRLKQLTQMLTSQNQNLKNKVESLQKQNKLLLKNDSILGAQLKKRQQKIISQINQKIDASVYQNILLQQAKGIQDLIKCNKHELYQNKLKQKQNLNLSVLQTVIPNHTRSKKQLQNVSEFTTCGQRNSAQTIMIKRPYFTKNEQIIQNQQGVRQGRNKDKYVLASTEKKKGLKMERDKLKSSVTNLPLPTQQYPTSKLRSRNSSQNKSSKRLPTRITNEDRSANGKHLQVPNVMTSDFLLTETALQEQNLMKANNSRYALAEIVETECNRNKNIQLNNTNFNQMFSSKNTKRDQNKNTFIFQNEYEKHVPFQYRTINLKNEEPYQNYMKYHLRNSIIETLSKKGKQCSIKKQMKKIQQEIFRGQKVKNNSERRKCDLFIRNNSYKKQGQSGLKLQNKKITKSNSFTKSQRYMNKLNNLRC